MAAVAIKDKEAVFSYRTILCPLIEVLDKAVS
jgi:hypothetical protein